MTRQAWLGKSLGLPCEETNCCLTEAGTHGESWPLPFSFRRTFASTKQVITLKQTCKLVFLLNCNSPEITPVPSLPHTGRPAKAAGRRRDPEAAGQKAVSLCELEKL